MGHRLGKQVFHYQVGDSIEAMAAEGIVGSPSISPKSHERNPAISRSMVSYILDLDVSIWVTKPVDAPLLSVSSYFEKGEGLRGRKVLLKVSGKFSPQKRTKKSSRHTGTPFTTRGYTYGEIRKRLSTIPES